MNQANEHIIQGVRFIAVRMTVPRPHWCAKVEQTGITLQQTYVSRPAMWEDLDMCARLSGSRFASDSLAAR